MPFPSFPNQARVAGDERAGKVGAFIWNARCFPGRFSRSKRPALARWDFFAMLRASLCKPMKPRPPLPPFTEETAKQKVQMAEDAWNSRDPERVSLAYTPDTEWRNRDVFLHGRAEVVEFLTRKWAKEQDYRLKKTLWAFTGNRIAVRFEYEWHDDAGQWWRSHGNENWEFDEHGYMARRFASINDQAIHEQDRRFRWERA